MVKFVITKDDLYPDQIAFLGGDYTSISSCDTDQNSCNDGLSMVETKDEFIPDLDVLERAGFIKVVHDFDSIEEPSDILRCTKKVEMLQGGTVKLRVYILDGIWEFTESELLGPTALVKRLIRLKKAVYVKKEEWQEILSNWLRSAEDVIEINEDEEVREKFLLYILRCRIYTEIEKSLGVGALFYDESDHDVVYCLSNNLKIVLKTLFVKESEVSLRKIRWLLTDFISGESVQRRVMGERKRFWRISINAAGIDVKKQLFSEEDETILEHIEDGGKDDQNN